jgi:hypothetical protein
MTCPSFVEIDHIKKVQNPECMTSFSQSDCLYHIKLYYKDLTPALGGQFGLANYEVGHGFPPSQLAHLIWD